MRITQSTMIAAITASTASVLAFQTHINTSPRIVQQPSTTTLNAFQLKDGETQNMFEGPAPLVKERDACGVGFIANTKSGGELYMLWFSLFKVGGVVL